MIFSLTSSAMRLMRLDLLTLVRNLGDDDGLAAAGDVLRVALGAHHEAATAGPVRLRDVCAPVEIAAGGEVRPLHMLKDGLDACQRVLDQRDAGVDDLGEVVRRGCWSPCRRRCRCCR